MWTMEALAIKIWMGLALGWSYNIFHSDANPFYTNQIQTLKYRQNLSSRVTSEDEVFVQKLLNIFNISFLKRKNLFWLRKLI